MARLRCDAERYNKVRGRSGLATHDGLVQQIRAWLIPAPRVQFAVRTRPSRFQYSSGRTASLHRLELGVRAPTVIPPGRCFELMTRSGPSVNLSRFATSRSPVEGDRSDETAPSARLGHLTVLLLHYFDRCLPRFHRSPEPCRIGRLHTSYVQVN